MMLPEPDAVECLRRTYEVLVQDCQLAEHLVREADSPFRRRVFVRALSSYVEGMGHQLKCVVRDAYESLTPDQQGRIQVICKFTHCEIAWIKARRDNLSALDRFCKSLRVYAKLYIVPFELCCKPELRKFIDLRNRVTHPKSASDLEVQDADLKESFSTAQSVIDELARLIAATNAKNSGL